MRVNSQLPKAVTRSSSSLVAGGRYRDAITMSYPSSIRAIKSGSSSGMLLPSGLNVSSTSPATCGKACMYPWRMPGVVWTTTSYPAARAYSTVPSVEPPSRIRI